MSILTQAGVIALITVIVFILIRSNKRLIEAAEEGEHFVDEWALREERKRQLISRSPQDKPHDQREVNQPLQDMAQDQWETDLLSQNVAQDQWEVSQPLQDIGPDQREIDSLTREEVCNQSQEGSESQETERLLRETSLTFIELDEKGKAVNRISVRHLPFTIGRAPDNDLVIDDLCAARHHCRIVRRNLAIIMEDGGSRNKLAVGGRFQAETVLKDRMIIGIGSRDFMVEMRESNG